MNVRMMVKVLSPRVEYRQKADLSTEVLWVATNPYQRFGHCLEEDAVNYSLVLEGQRGERLGQRENDMKVFDRQKVSGAVMEPCRP